jgi:hypothetical protein
MDGIGLVFGENFMLEFKNKRIGHLKKEIYG